MTDLTSAIADHVLGLATDRLPPAVAERAQHLVLDLWGIMLRARHEAESTACLVATLGDLGLAGGPSRVVGDAQGYAPFGAALLNGALAHSLDFDDTHAAGSIHPGAAVIPAVIAAAQMPGADRAAGLAAVVGGYDLTCRLSLALGPSRHYARGFHPSATCGVFGAAVAAGRVLGLDRRQMANALGLCGSEAAGSLQFLENGAWNKRWQVGAAAARGLAAALAARNGFVGAARPLEGRHGFLHGYTDRAEPERLTEGLGTRFSIMETAIKPYPACRYTHAAIDGLAALRSAHAVTPGDIAAVRIGLPKTGLTITAEPAAAKRRPASVVDGQFSMHFLAAVVLQTGGMTWDDYDRHLGDAATEALCDRVEVTEDPRVEALYPRNMAASVRLTLADGRTLERLVERPGGEPECFPDLAGHMAKFGGLVARALGAARTEALADAVLTAAASGAWGPAFALSLPAHHAARDNVPA